MEIKGSITINKSQQVVADLFANPENLKEYQDGFLRKEPISGTPGAVGAVAKLYYRFGKGEMELTETVMSNELPNSFEASYQHKHMDNTMKSVFVIVDETTTRYDYEVAYTRISWIMPKLMFTLFPGMFRKQAEKWMQQFKIFAEKQPHE